MVWLQHGVDIWHLDCDPSGGRHDFIASVSGSNGKYELEISSEGETPLRRNFPSIASLNQYLQSIGLEELQL